MRIKDFGEKIGGAKKDLWKIRGLVMEDTKDMTEAEKSTYIKRDNIWPKINEKQLIDAGVPRLVVYWQKEMRKAVVPNLKKIGYDDENIARYINVVSDLKKEVMSIRSKDEIEAFGKKAYQEILVHKSEYTYFYAPKYDGILKTGKLFLSLVNPSNLSALEQKMEKEGYELSKKESPSKSKTRKKKWMPPQLEHIKRSGKNYRNDLNVSGDDFMEAFGIRGGEFGNWTNERDRQVNLNMAFDAFLDLAAALNISRRDVSLPELKLGSLAIAFGARGSGNALAHYEMGREVINLTKMRGAGSLAHEWGHALDDMIGKKNGCTVGKFASSDLTNPNLPGTFVTLVTRLRHDQMCRPTNYLNQSRDFGLLASRSGHDYWVSSEELFARAFACYVKDKLCGRNDYLVGHADTCSIKNCKGEMIYAYPIGDERKCFNQLFDDLFEELKTLGYFHDPMEKYQIKMPVFHMNFSMEPEAANFEQLTLNFENTKLF